MHCATMICFDCIVLLHFLISSMRVSLFATLCLAIGVAASAVEGAAYNADNCLRAVTGTFKGAARVFAARKQ